MSETKKRAPKGLYGGWSQRTFDSLNGGLGKLVCCDADGSEDVAHTLRLEANLFGYMAEKRGPEYSAKAQLWNAVADAIDCYQVRVDAIKAEKAEAVV